MGITHNDYIRTTDPRHKRGAQKLFSTIYERGYIYLASYTGSYCVSDEAFIDAPVGTPCPDCGRLLEEVTEENFFFKLSELQEQLIDLIESKTLLITPEASRNEVLKFLRGNTSIDPSEWPEIWVTDSDGNYGYTDESIKEQTQVRLESGRFARAASGTLYEPGALRDLSISRSSFTWGIPVPEPAASQAKQPHVIYVWLDALANYMTALGYGSDDETLWEKFWPADLHLVGKEITRFHCVYWPAFLLAAGLPTPKQITANGWLLFDNAKMSKSKGNIVRTETILDAFGTLCPPPVSGASETSANSSLVKGTASAVPSDTPQDAALASEGMPAEPTSADRDLFAADILRYYLLREIPFGQDGTFSFESLITRYNADLANGYGNLVSRTLTMIHQFFDGVIPQGEMNQEHTIRYVMANVAGTMVFDTSKKDSLEFSKTLEHLAFYVSRLDSYLSEKAPWKLVKLQDEASQTELRNVLYTAIEGVRMVTLQLHAFIPFSAEVVIKRLGYTSIESANYALLPNHRLPHSGIAKQIPPIFPRAPKELAQIMTDMENPTPVPETTAPDAAPRALDAPSQTLPVAGSQALTTGPAPTPLASPHLESPSLESPQITIDDFAKIDLRVAQITLAERIPKADKLLRLEVDLGPLGTRQILSGIAEFYTPEELLGRRIVVIANLAPRKMRGLESHGMLLAASDGDHGKPHLATCGEEIPLGSRLK
jgi:methionyl-tRNA synthetase